MTTISFYKMQSLGNDFLVLDAVSCEHLPSTAQLQKLGHRKFGIGFDQCLVIAPPSVDTADFDYQIYNADGSEAEQCGNGTRCVARLVSHLKLSPKTALVWSSKGGIIYTTVKPDGQVETIMPTPSFDHAAVAFDASSCDGDGKLSVEEHAFAITPVSMGNPHGVIFVDDIAAAPVTTIGRCLSMHTAFQQDANIGFAQIVDNKFLRLRVYERGVGETLACGTGACAAVAAAAQQQLVSERVKVSLPGGKLWVSWAGQDAPVKLTGPAHLVFHGEIDLEALNCD